MSLAGVEEPSALQLRARQVAFLSVAAPTVFVFMSVLLYLGAVGYLVCRLRSISRIGDRDEVRAADAGSPRRAWSLGAGHCLVFLGLHLSNHLVGLAGPDADEGANLQADRQTVSAAVVGASHCSQKLTNTSQMRVAKLQELTGRLATVNGCSASVATTVTPHPNFLVASVALNSREPI